MIKAIVFDKDGTLLDYDRFWIPVAEKAILQLLKSKALEAASCNELMKSIGAYDGIRGILCYGTYADIANAINKKLSRNELFSPSEAAAAFENATESGELAPTCDDIVSLMKNLKSNGYTVAMVTSDNEKMARFCLEKLGIIDYFDKIIFDDGIHPPKPDPYHMNSLCREMNISPNEVLMVGDTLTDMRFAENSGTHFMGVAKDSASADILRPHTKYLAKDISYVLDIAERINTEK